MLRSKKIFLSVLTIFIFSLLLHQPLGHNTIFAQEGTSLSEFIESPQAQKLIQSGRMSPQQLQEILTAARRGQISPEIISQYQKKAEQGSLTPAEIEAGKKLLESKEKELSQTTAADDVTMPEKAAKIPAEKEVAKTPAEKEKEVETQEEYLHKNDLPEQQDLSIFGHKFFSGSPSTFAPIQNVPVSNNYIVGPGDEIKILMWGRLDESYSLEVDNEGIINFPKIGPLTVAGLTFGELKELIKQKAESITGVSVNVSMGRLRTIQIFVLGEVKHPGVYTVSSLATMINAILSSGGPTSLSSLRKIQLKRRNKVVTTIDLYDFLIQGDTSSDARLMPGDVIFIPQAGPMISVSGNVKRPAIYELIDKGTLRETLNLAGGLTPRGFNQRIQVERAFQNQFQIILDISYEGLKQKKPIYLQDGDLIQVFSILPPTINAVYLYGNVNRPGQYEHKPGMRILDIILDLKNLDKDTYFDYALIKRYHMEKMKAELIPFDLGGLLFQKDESQNIPLIALDEIYIFNKSMFEDREYAVVNGQVRKPGCYLIDDMRIKDLIFKAGRLDRDAYMEMGHLYRTNWRTKEVTLLTFNLEKAMADDDQHNLLLQDLDEVVIHNIREYVPKEWVSITGMVNNSGEYAYATDMTIKDLILVAGNVKDAAYMDKAELTRFKIIKGKKVETSILEFNLWFALQNDPLHNLQLKPMDVVTVKTIPDWREKTKTVSITGEVFFPGMYQIRKNEKLSSLIKRAGGYNEYAYLSGAFFTRKSAKKIQQKRIKDLIKKMEIDSARISSQEAQASLSTEDLAAQKQYGSHQTYLLSKLRETKASGRVIINLLPLDSLKNSSTDFGLEAGDTLHIPKKPQIVNVIGSVYNPTSLIYKKDKNKLKYYLAKTGGPTENANSRHMYLIRLDGTVISKKHKRWSQKFKNMKIYPGDTILVPEKITRPRYMRDVKDITEILYQIAVTAGITATQVF